MTWSLALKIWQWFTTLDQKKLIIALFSAIIAMLLFENNNLRTKNDRLDSRVVINGDRCDSIKSVYESRIQECNDKRIQDLEKSNLFWSRKVENLEEKLYDSYKPTKQVR